jgi:predicted RNA-binding protein associated with RNAse of E/G family
LIGSARQDLAAAVKAGAITGTQADAALQAQRTQIIAMLTSNRPLLKVAAAGK